MSPAERRALIDRCAHLACSEGAPIRLTPDGQLEPDELRAIEAAVTRQIRLVGLEPPARYLTTFDLAIAIATPHIREAK